jgi:hypothetical protein
MSVLYQRNGAIGSGLRRHCRRSRRRVGVVGERSWPVSQGEFAVAAVDAAGRKAGIVHLANFPDGGAGFGAAGLTSWSMTIRTGGAQQVGDAAVAGRMLGGAELSALHRPPPAL